jgi:hypothetical protein
MTTQASPTVLPNITGTYGAMSGHLPSLLRSLDGLKHLELHLISSSVATGATWLANPSELSQLSSLKDLSHVTVSGLAFGEAQLRVLSGLPAIKVGYVWPDENQGSRSFK